MSEPALKTFKTEEKPITELSIDASIKSLEDFIDYIKSVILDYQNGLKTFYEEYLTLVDLKLTPTVNFASFRKADSIYTKLSQSMDKLRETLREDYVTTAQNARELKWVHAKRLKFIEQRTAKNVPQMIAKISNISKQFKHMAKEYHDKMENFLQLQNNLDNRMIIYTSLSGKVFKISVKEESNEFFELLGVTEESGLLEIINTKFVDEFANKIESIEKDNLISITALKSLYPDRQTQPGQAAQPGQPGQPRQPEQPRKRIKLHVINLVASIKVQDLPPNQVTQIKDKNVFTILLQTAKTGLFNVFNIWKNEFMNLPQFDEFKVQFEYMGILDGIPENVDRGMNHVAKQLVDGYENLSNVHSLYSITDIINVEDSNPDKIPFLKNWLLWTNMVHAYLCFRMDEESDIDLREYTTGDGQKLKLKYCHRNILIYLYGQCLSEVEGKVRDDNRDRVMKRTKVMEECKKLIELKLSNTVSNQDQELTNIRNQLYNALKELHDIPLSSGPMDVNSN